MESGRGGQTFSAVSSRLKWSSKPPGTCRRRRWGSEVVPSFVCGSLHLSVEGPSDAQVPPVEVRFKFATPGMSEPWSTAPGVLDGGLPPVCPAGKVFSRCGLQAGVGSGVRGPSRRGLCLIGLRWKTLTPGTYRRRSDEPGGVCPRPWSWSLSFGAAGGPGPVLSSSLAAEQGASGGPEGAAPLWWSWMAFARPCIMFQGYLLRSDDMRVFLCRCSSGL